MFEIIHQVSMLVESYHTNERKWNVNVNSDWFLSIVEQTVLINCWLDI